MAEEFDPNAFRQQMATSQGQAPIPMPVPAAPVQGQAQTHMPQQQHYAPPAQPQSAPQPYAPPAQPQSSPQQYAPQHAQQQAAQFQAPQPQVSHPQGQPYQAPQAQPPVQEQFRPHMQPAYGQAPQMPAHNIHGQAMMPTEVKEPSAKKSLFKRKKLKAATEQMMPQMDGAMDMMPASSESGKSRFIVFLGGLLVGALGTMASIMLFSGNEPQRANVAVNQAKQTSTIEKLPDASQIALTDEMLIKSQNKGQGSRP